MYTCFFFENTKKTSKGSPKTQPSQCAIMLSHQRNINNPPTKSSVLDPSLGKVYLPPTPFRWALFRWIAQNTDKNRLPGSKPYFSSYPKGRGWPLGGTKPRLEFFRRFVPAPTLQTLHFIISQGGGGGAFGRYQAQAPVFLEICLQN